MRPHNLMEKFFPGSNSNYAHWYAFPNRMVWMRSGKHDDYLTYKDKDFLFPFQEQKPPPDFEGVIIAFRKLGKKSAVNGHKFCWATTEEEVERFLITLKLTGYL